MTALALLRRCGAMYRVGQLSEALQTGEGRLRVAVRVQVAKDARAATVASVC
jgi:hypothetical protein